MPDDARTIPVTLDIEPESAAVLGDDAKRAWVGRIVSRMLQPASVERLFDAIAALKAEAHANGLTDEILDEELAAYNAERRSTPPVA